jgi:hypothetical protein
VARFQDRLRDIASQASPRTGFFFVLAFVLLLVWIVWAVVSGD